jgi:nitrite reductase/ring-hydroxylating ferredoxin subunit
MLATREKGIHLHTYGTHACMDVFVSKNMYECTLYTGLKYKGKQGVMCEVDADDVEEVDVALFCVNGTFFATQGMCPRDGQNLHRGEIIVHEGDEHACVKCPAHACVFDLVEGRDKSSEMAIKVKNASCTREYKILARTLRPLRADIFANVANISISICIHISIYVYICYNIHRNFVFDFF